MGTAAALFEALEATYQAGHFAHDDRHEVLWLKYRLALGGPGKSKDEDSVTRAGRAAMPGAEMLIVARGRSISEPLGAVVPPRCHTVAVSDAPGARLVSSDGNIMNLAPHRVCEIGTVDISPCARGAADWEVCFAGAAAPYFVAFGTYPPQ